MRKIDDTRILLLFRDNKTKEEGFNLLVEKYKEQIYWHIRRIVVSKEDTEDILQDTFLNIYRHLDSFKENSSLYTWIYRVATNECGMMFRKRKILTSSIDDCSEVLISKLHQECGDTGDEILVKFQEAILQLPHKQKLVFNLRYYEEMSYDDISKILESSVSSLKTNYHYASEKIKEYMIKNS